MKLCRMLLPLGVLLAAFGPVLAAQQLELTVQEAVTRALAADPDVAAAVEAADAARSALEARRLDRLPAAGLAASYSRLNEVDPIVIGPVTAAAPANSYGLSAQLRQPLFGGGRIAAQVRGAALEAQAALQGAAAAQLDLRLRVVRCYWQLQRQGAAVTALQERSAQVRQLVGELESRVRSGAAIQEDLLRLRSLAADTDLRLERTRSARDLAALELALLAGLPRGLALVPVSDLPEGLPGLPALEELWGRAREEHPQLLAARLRVQAASSAEHVLRAGLYPSLALSGAVGWQSPDPRGFPPEEELAPFWQLGAAISFDLLSPVRVSTRLREATARRRAAEDGARGLEDRLYLGLHRAYAEALLAEQEVQAAAAAQLYAEELRRAVQDRYAQGAALRSELLDAQAAVLEARLRLTDARVSRVVGRAALAAACGAARALPWAQASGFTGEAP